VEEEKKTYAGYGHGVFCWKSILAGLEHFKSLVCFVVKNGEG